MNKASIVALAIALALGSATLSQETKTEAAPNKQTAPTLRVAFGMNLDYGDDFERIAQAADIKYQKVRALNLGGWHGWWAQEGAKGLSRSDIQSATEFKTLAGGGVDVFVLSKLRSMPQEGHGKNKTEFLAELADVGVNNNPDFRVLWRLWLEADGNKSKGVFSLEGTRRNADPQNSKYLEEEVNKINGKHGKQVVLIVPTAFAEIKLVNMVVEGKFHGVKDPKDLWVQYNMHGDRFLKVLAAYCNFAVIYGISPEGLEPSFKRTILFDQRLISSTQPGRYLGRATRDFAENRLGDGFQISLCGHQQVTATFGIGGPVMNSQQSRLAAALLAGLILPAIHHSARGEDLKAGSLTVEQAKEIVAGKNVELVQSVTELSVEMAQVLSQFSKGDLRLNRVRTITPEVARALAPQGKKGVTLWLGLTTITPEVAKALAAHSRGMLALNALGGIPVEVARELAQFHGKLTLNGLTTLSPEVARELAKHQRKFTLFGLTEISYEAAEALSDHRSTILLNGLTKLTSAPLTAKMLKANDGFLNLSKVRTLSDEVVQIFAEYQGRPIRLTGLTELSEANAARLRTNEKVILPLKFQKG